MFTDKHPQQTGSSASSTDFRQRAAAQSSSTPGAGQPPTRIERIAQALAAQHIASQTSAEEPFTQLILLDDTPRFRMVAPPRSPFMLLVADVFSGTDEEIAQMAPSLLHANFSCQRMALQNPMGLPMPSEGDAEYDAVVEDMQCLPVMGLDLERMTVVLSLQMPASRLDDPDFGVFLASLLDTVHHDSGVLVEQFKGIAASLAV